MRMKRMISISAMALLLGVSSLHAQEEYILPAQTSDDGIQYLTGGIGREEQNIIATQRANYNLHIEMALKTGHYVSDVTIEVKDANDKETVLIAPAEGPFFFAKLEPGKYHVHAYTRTTSLNKTTTIPAKAHREINFYFPVSQYEDGLEQRGVE